MKGKYEQGKQRTGKLYNNEQVEQAHYKDITAAVTQKH